MRQKDRLLVPLIMKHYTRSLSDLFHVCASLNLGAVQGAPLCRPTTSGWQRRNAPKVRLALRVVARKARLRQETLTPTLPPKRERERSFLLLYPRVSWPRASGEG